MYVLLSPGLSLDVSSRVPRQLFEACLYRLRYSSNLQYEGLCMKQLICFNSLDMAPPFGQENWTSQSRVGSFISVSFASLLLELKCSRIFDCLTTINFPCRSFLRTNLSRRMHCLLYCIGVRRCPMSFQIWHYPKWPQHDPIHSLRNFIVHLNGLCGTISSQASVTMVSRPELRWQNSARRHSRK